MTNKKYPIGGFAPGNYTCKCVSCKENFMGDKRAVQCEGCATKEVKTEEIEYWKQLNQEYNVFIMKTKENYTEEFINYLYGDIEEDEKPIYAPDIQQSKKDFEAGWNSCLKHLNNFEEGEEVEVTDPYHYTTNFWFKRKFIQKDSDGKFTCRQIDGSVCRWSYIRKVIQ